jgi:hypothetical protein
MVAFLAQFPWKLKFFGLNINFRLEERLNMTNPLISASSNF